MTNKATAVQAGDAAAPEKANTVEVVLTKSHNHLGKPCKVGEKIHVTQRQKQFLQDNGKIDAVVGTAERVKEV